ncbi:unnamed protein product [Rotaria sp. Silwood2]|nr:unnamed protein product [Rotaria sp. Silwood2]CAF3189094.1 unnamed protein product [Rotaria sp. Silwood2]
MITILESTGFLPALQSYICRWNNPCHNQSKTVDEFNENSSTFLVNQSELIERIDFLCNNLSINDLKLFLINVQEQLDEIFLIDTIPNMINPTIDGLQIIDTMEELRTRWKILNISFPFDGINSSISLTSLCGDRNDLSRYFYPNKSLNTENNQTQLIIQPTYKIFKSFCNLSSDSLFICQQIKTYQTSINLFTILTDFIACSERNRFIPMNSELDIVREGQNKSVTNNFLAAIEFMDDLTNNDSLPKHIRYKIRIALDYTDNTFQTQDRVQTGKNIPYGIQTQQMPYPYSINDKFVNSISRMLLLLMVLNWIFTVSMNVKDIVHEKEKQLKEIMKIMGLKDSVHWFTEFILCTTVIMFTAFLLVLLLKLKMIEVKLVNVEIENLSKYFENKIALKKFICEILP